MTLGGWVLMLASTGGVTSLLVWCFYKVLTASDSAEHLHRQAEIHTPDQHDD